MTPVKYIGHRDTYKEGAYGSGLVFTKDLTINVDDDALARKLLRHKDVYELGEDTGESPAEAKENKSTQDDDPDQTARDAINLMNKAALEAYAKNNFRVDVDKRKSVAELRAQVTGLYDQFGLD